MSAAVWTSEVTLGWFEWGTEHNKVSPMQTHLSYAEACASTTLKRLLLLYWATPRKAAVILPDHVASFCAAWAYRQGLSHFQHHLRAHQQSGYVWKQSLTYCKELFFWDLSGALLLYQTLPSRASFSIRGFLDLHPSGKTFLYLFNGSQSQLKSYLSSLTSSH